MMSVKTDTLNCNSGPGSIQCERTSFLASAANSAGKKNISFFLVGVNYTVFLKSHIIETCLSHLTRDLTCASSKLTGRILLF